MPSVLKLENISKSFGANQVLKSVNLEISAGEIHGLVGENGSGKTTLLNILMGHPVIQQSGGYSGTVILDGKPVKMKSPQDAIRAGLGMVHQEFALLPGLTVAENIKLGRENLRSSTEKILGRNLAYVDRAKNREEANTILEKLGISMNTNMRAEDLPVNLKQYVEIARETGRNDLRVLILDEPTAAWYREDANRLMPVIRDLAGQGIAILFISHRLEEVLEICHRITVLRDGEIAADLRRDDSNFDLASVALAMMGRSVVETKRQTISKPGPVLVKFQSFAVDMPGETIKNFSLEIRQGEILGVAGLSGHGKLALGYGLMGVYPTRGSVLIDDRKLDTSCSSKILAEDICFLPDNRRESGLLLDQSILENVIFTATQHKNKFLRFHLGPLSMIDWKSGQAYVRQSVERFDIRCQDIHQKVIQLSGGNQQKVCLARAVAFEPRVLLAAEPTRGVDIGAKQAILEAMLQINEERGTTIICMSSELAELKQICDRIVIMYEGEIFIELSPRSPEVEFSIALGGKRSTEHAAH